MPDIRLIERWLPIAEIGEEATRERRSMTALPPTYYLHVWWARRPLVASRAAVLASLLPSDVDRNAFLRVLGVHGDPIAAQARIAEARRRGERFEGNAYGYGRAFTHVPDEQDRAWLDSKLGGRLAGVAILDPTAGGGAIPFEALRIGTGAVVNELNIVAVTLLTATLQWPLRHGVQLLREFDGVSQRLIEAREARLLPHFPSEPTQDAMR